MKNKDQQAQQYAEKQLSDICLMLDYEENKQIGYFHTYDIQKAYIDGYTACEQSMWRSVEEELPEDDSYFYFVADVNKNPLAVDCAEYACETKKFSRGGQILHPTHWMHIPTPSLPDTNTEKR